MYFYFLFCFSFRKNCEKENDIFVKARIEILFTLEISIHAKCIHDCISIARWLLFSICFQYFDKSDISGSYCKIS